MTKQKLGKFFGTKFSDLEEDDEPVSVSRELGYYVKTIGCNRFTVHLNQDFREPEYYTNVINMMINASENDTIIFMINSPGGLMSGLSSMLDALGMTEATTLAYLAGECSSAASIFALHCDEVHVGPYSHMNCHNVRYGTGGKGADIVSHVQHMTKISDNLMYDTYSGFLDEDEIMDMLDGKEIYLDAEEIQERLVKMKEFRAKEFDDKLSEIEGDSAL